MDLSQFGRDDRLAFHTGTLDYDQRCHCCGGEYAFDTEGKWMRCLDKKCSAFGVRFTIPWKAYIAHHPRKKVIVTEVRVETEDGVPV